MKLIIATTTGATSITTIESCQLTMNISTVVITRVKAELIAG